VPSVTRFGPMSISIMTALIYVCAARVSRKALVAQGPRSIGQSPTLAISQLC